MKTLRLNKSESAAYAAGERCFWRAMRKQPYCPRGWWRSHDGYWTYQSRYINKIDDAAGRITCPYGTPGDRVEAVFSTIPGCVHMTITAITVENRNGKWGWVVEVGQ